MRMSIGERVGLADRSRRHYRECRRREVDIGAEVQIHLPDGTYYDRGTARISNISASGALLSDLRLGGGGLPVGEFVLRVAMSGEPYRGVVLRCRPVRISAPDSGVGVRLDDVGIHLDAGHGCEGGPRRG